MGDRIDLVLRDKTETYVIDKIQIVEPTDVGVLQPEHGSSLTLDLFVRMEDGSLRHF